jgi:hypothetical protein
LEEVRGIDFSSEKFFVKKADQKIGGENVMEPEH